jgi:hypothetical protein
MVLRNSETLTVRPPQRGQTQKTPTFSSVRVNPLPQFGQMNMIDVFAYFGSKSATKNAFSLQLLTLMTAWKMRLSSPA